MLEEQIEWMMRRIEGLENERKREGRLEDGSSRMAERDGQRNVAG